MDLLNDILSTLNLKGTLYFRTEFSGKWAVAVPELEHAARFHLVIKGQCHVNLGENRFETLNPGDIILIPRGKSHILSDSPQKTAPPLEKVILQSGYNGDGLLVYGSKLLGLQTQMVCGHFTFRAGADHPALRIIPEFITLRAQERENLPLLNESLNMISDRVFSQNMGSSAAMTRLSEIVYMEILQKAISESDAAGFSLEALADNRIAKSLRLIHSHPDRSWTIDELASEVAMSRSRFFEKFRKLVGETPMSYLSQWRLQKSLELLTDNKKSIQQVAFDAGYQSPAAFSRAFNDKFGVSPSGYRLSLVG